MGLRYLDAVCITPVMHDSLLSASFYSHDLVAKLDYGQQGYQ